MLRAGHQGVSTPAFTPADDTGLKGWFEGDSGITLDGSSKVSAWADRAGGIGDLAQATAGKRFSMTTVNGLACPLGVTASATGIRRSTNAGGALTQPITQIWVVRCDGAGASDNMVFDGVTTRQFFQQRPGSTQVLFAGNFPAGIAATVTTLALWVVVFDGASSKLYKNDVTTPVATVDAGTQGIDGLSIGEHATPGFYNFEGPICAGIIRSGVADATLLGQYKTYLSRWGTF